MTIRSDQAAPFTLAERDRIAVVAGSGNLPVQVVDELVRKGHRPLVIAIKGEAEWQDRPDAFDLVTLPPEEFGRLLPKLKREGITHLVLAGGVSRRPRIRKIKLGLGLIGIIPKLIAAYRRGDDGLLRTIIGYIEKNGIKVVGAHEIAPDLLAPEGVLTRARPMAGDRKDILAGLAAARAIGALDIGQGAVAIGGRAIALEGIEGTDGLLARTREMRNHGRLAGKRRGVLVKCAKPGQELRADLPAIGPDTIEGAHAAGLAGVAVEADHTFILDFTATVERANALGLFVVGLGEA
ncbi:hypothetical protein L598_001600000640 [Mesorhizobium sp. J18]|uniref:LpxI family protein n=1 Tax=Mesorhizobium sp. J18 TaxID=935263 RepID=UPI001198F1CD|nr:UDP-2,3-diacylglucosamine diphosphatase LpxI [Mesorhizobium sp. J18]TWG99100.1 hypothetical protein L598_001600000640 [Mesorhizobium sp. J18]